MLKYVLTLFLILLLSGCSGGTFIKPIKSDRSGCKNKIGENKKKCFEQTELLKKSLEKHKSNK